MFKKFFSEFKEFAMRGSVIDLAVGVVIGGAFGKITSSLVNDIIMPPLGLALAQVNFSDLYINLSSQQYESLAEAKLAGAAVISYGEFLNNVIHFIIIAFSVFLVIKVMNTLKRQEEAKTKTPKTKECPYCLTQVPVKATRCLACTSQLKD